MPKWRSPRRGGAVAAGKRARAWHEAWREGRPPFSAARETGARMTVAAAFLPRDWCTLWQQAGSLRAWAAVYTRDELARELAYAQLAGEYSSIRASR